VMRVRPHRVSKPRPSHEVADDRSQYDLGQYSSDPHLHSAVQVTRAKGDHFEAVSVPFVFKHSATSGEIAPRARLELWK
jgi:hypothetical protein